MSKKLAILTGILSLALASGVAAAKSADKPAPKATVSTASSTAPVLPAKAKAHHVAHVRTEVSKQCSDEANAKNLHGNERRAFRHHCMKEHTAQATALGKPASTTEKPAKKAHAVKAPAAIKPPAPTKS